MKYNSLGTTGLYVSEICFGAMTFGGSEHPGLWKTVGEIRQEEANAILSRVVDAGVNFIDTADVYANGDSERILGQAIRDIGLARKDLIIATKVYAEAGPGPNDRGASRAHIMDSISRSLERLKMDYIDLYLLHGSDPVTPLDESLRALDDLIRQNMVRYAGVSNWQAWTISKALGITTAKNLARLDVLQAYYSLASRDIEREIIPMLKDEGLGLMIWSPLASGLLSGKFGRDIPAPDSARRINVDFPPVEESHAWNCIDALREVASRHGVSVARVALAWLLHQEQVTSIIIGARNLVQLDDNLAAAEMELSDDDLQKLDEVSRLTPEYPAWMVERQARYRVPKSFHRN